MAFILTCSNLYVDSHISHHIGKKISADVSDMEGNQSRQIVKHHSEREMGTGIVNSYPKIKLIA